MKTLDKYINEQIIDEQLLLEYLIGFCSDYDIAVNLPYHADERETRHNKDYISKVEILSAIAKVAKQIKDDLDLNVISFNDEIIIEDKSKDITTNFVCIIDKDSKNKTKFKITIKTNMRKDNFKKYNIKKTYSTYISDKDVYKKIKLLNVGV